MAVETKTFIFVINLTLQVYTKEPVKLFYENIKQ